MLTVEQDILYNENYILRSLLCYDDAMTDKEAETHISSWQRHKTLYLWIIAYLIVMVIVACVAIVGSLNAPQDLGTDLVYIGRDDYGCAIGFCDSPPTSIYFFSTNMSIVSFKNLIVKLGYVYDTNDSSEYNGNAGLSFFGPAGSSGLDINYYSDPKAAQDSTKASLKITDKQHVVSMYNDVYTRLRQSLQKAGKL